MSSDMTYLTAEGIAVVQNVLKNAGFGNDIWSTAPINVRAQFLIKLFVDGMTEPERLRHELVRRFGRVSTIEETPGSV